MRRQMPGGTLGLLFGILYFADLLVWCSIIAVHGLAPLLRTSTNGLARAFRDDAGTTIPVDSVSGVVHFMFMPQKQTGPMAPIGLKTIKSSCSSQGLLMRYSQPKQVRFLPWCGKNYCKSYPRLLVLGESHYSDRLEDPNFTQRLTAQYAAGKFNHRFWTQIGQVVTGKPHWEINRKAFWDSISFYNYVQDITVNAPGYGPPESAFLRSENAFWEVLDLLKPTHLIALGDRLWTHMPEFGNESATAPLGGQSRQYGYYIRNWGQVIAVSIKHPSWGFSAQVWHPVVRDFLAIKP